MSASGWIEAMEKVWRSPLVQHRIRLNRGDIMLLLVSNLWSLFVRVLKNQGGHKL